MLNKKDLQDLIKATQLHVALPEAVIEKDYYVTCLINSLANIENDHFRLIFCGGTCLAKAHKVVKRLSEDIDFKIQVKNLNTFTRKNQLLKELKIFRSQLINAITDLREFNISQTAIRNEGKYSRIELSYPEAFNTHQMLRPHLLLELTLSDIRLASDQLSINTIIEEHLEISPLFRSSLIHCISHQETAAEKWVGLTRRIAAIERGYHQDDSTLVRHIYDLYAIKKINKINDRFYNLVGNIVQQDAAQFKNQHSEYFNNVNK